MNPYFVRFSDLKQLLRPEGPVFAFAVPWIAVLLLQQLTLTTLIRPIYSSAYLMVIANIVGVFVFTIFFHILRPIHLIQTRMRLTPPSFSANTKKIIKTLFFLLVILQLIQGIYFGGWPLLWLLTGSTKVYKDYGIPSLNGLLNALYLLCTTAIFLIYLKDRKRQDMITLLFALCLPVLLISRQLLISLCVQVLCCWLIYRPQALKKVMVYGILLGAIFVSIGHLRTGLVAFLEAYPPSDQLPTSLYPLLWIYVYLVTPFNNINMNIDYIHPIGWPYFEMQAFLPTVIRTPLMSLLPDVNNFFEYDHYEQVNTFYFEPVMDFGALYGFLFMTMAQLIAIYLYRRTMSSTSSLFYVLSYAVFYQILLLSVFHNFLLFPPVIYQLFILLVLHLKFTPYPYAIRR